MFGKRKDWNHIRSTHATVLESLEQVIARHPANAAEATLGRRGDDRRAPAEADAAEATGDAARTATSANGSDAVVLPFRPRLRVVAGSGPGAA